MECSLFFFLCVCVLLLLFVCLSAVKQKDLWQESMNCVHKKTSLVRRGDIGDLRLAHHLSVTLRLQRVHRRLSVAQRHDVLPVAQHRYRRHRAFAIHNLERGSRATRAALHTVVRQRARENSRKRRRLCTEAVLGTARHRCGGANGEQHQQSRDAGDEKRCMTSHNEYNVVDGNVSCEKKKRSCKLQSLSEQPNTRKIEYGKNDNNNNNKRDKRTRKHSI